MQPDKETAKVLNKGKVVRDFVKSDVWEEIKSELIAKVVAEADITTVEEADPVALLQEIKARKKAINIVMGWIREVEGEANKYEANEQAFRTIREESIIVY